MFRGCPATGRMMHFFDKTTHRCRCGRWERGHKPKVAPVMPRAECQICERHWAVEGGRLVHHGYRRPGIGFILGDCYGVGHAPYPATDALAEYAAALDNRLAGLRERLVKLPMAGSLVYERRYYASHMDYRRKHETVVEITVNRGDAARYDNANGNIPSFDDLMAGRVRATEREIEDTERERARVAARIEAAKVLLADELRSLARHDVLRTDEEAAVGRARADEIVAVLGEDHPASRKYLYGE